MTDYHVITHELVMQVIGGQIVIVPPVSAVAAPHAGPAPTARPVGAHLGAPAPASLQPAAAPALSTPCR